MKQNIILIGMMGCGKSTCGRLLAQRLQLDFVDTDALIEEKAAKSIPHIFAQDGEAAFRTWEVSVSGELAQSGPLVIACGGGLPMDPRAMAPLRESGTVVFLDRDPGEIFDRVNMSGRPLAQQGRDAFLARWAQREPIYRQWADFSVKSQATPQETVNLIMEGL